MRGTGPSVVAMRRERRRSSILFGTDTATSSTAIDLRFQIACVRVRTLWLELGFQMTAIASFLKRHGVRTVQIGEGLFKSCGTADTNTVVIDGCGSLSIGTSQCKMESVIVVVVGL